MRHTQATNHMQGYTGVFIRAVSRLFFCFLFFFFWGGFVAHCPQITGDAKAGERQLA